MPAKTAPSPKANLLRASYGKVFTVFKRSMGEVGRVRGTPKSAERELAKAQKAVADVLVAQFGRQLPVVTVEDAAPKGEHWLVSGIESPRNALYARSPLTVSVAFVAKDGTCPVGAVYLPMEELCIVAEAGLGASGEGVGRLRVGGRIELEGALAMLPAKTPDVIKLKLMEKLDKEGLHTRKSGNGMADIVEVVLGRADIAICTRVNRLEALLGNLLMAESGGFASDLKGKPVGPESETMLVGNTKLHAQALKVLK